MKKKSQFRSGRGATRFGHPQPLQSFSRTRSLELASTFSQALALHQAGRLAEAEKIYGQILKVQPNHFDSLHLVGVIYAQRGSHVESVRQIDVALKINPKAAPAHNNRGIALQKLKRLDDALASYDKAIALKPDYAEAFNRGLALRGLKRLEEALASYDRALAPARLCRSLLQPRHCAAGAEAARRGAGELRPRAGGEARLRGSWL